MYDVLIIGGGITGACVAMELSKYRLDVAWLERHNDVAMETTKANSGIIHAGYDPKPGTHMARLNVLGAKLFQELAPRLNIRYRIAGSLVIGKSEADLQSLRALYRRGIENGVEGLALLEGEPLRQLEPNLREDVRYGLLAPTAAIISPWEACLAFGQTAVHNGVRLFLGNAVTAIDQIQGGYRVTSSCGQYDTRYVINCAGVHADRVFDLLKPVNESFTVTPVRGQYYLLDKSQGQLVHHVIFQPPGEKGKGVVVAPTVHGNLIVGPDARPSARDDVSVAGEDLQAIRKAAEQTTNQINYRENIRNFAGLRAKIQGRSDFLLEESKEFPGFINFAGIQSPGLSCGPALGVEAAALLQRSGLSLMPKEDFTYVPLPPSFQALTPQQINERIQKDAGYGRIVCRCETVSEGQIVEAIHGIIGATTVDGVKRRTNAGMGRCQGGFCGPRILEILHRELGLEPAEICQDQAGSYIVSSMRGGT